MKKLFFMIALLLPTSALAEVPPLSSSSQPVEISAAKSLEWNRKAKTYTARQNVIVKQGDVKIQSDLLTARYTDENGMTDISALEAENNVTINSPPYTAYGDKAVYNVKTGNAVLTGKDLKVTTGTDVLTAQEKIEFFGTENKLTARGNALATHGTDTLSADALSAHFIKGEDGKMVADRITGEGGVTIKTLKETVTGDSGVYNVQTQKAVLTGKVRIYQGENWLEGTRADVDMATGISRLSGAGKEDDGRVKGVFYPKSTPQPESLKQ